MSTTHVVSSSILGVGAGHRVSAVRWGVAKNIVIAWFITIPASAIIAGLSFYLIRRIHVMRHLSGGRWVREAEASTLSL